jgi:diaminopimelate epimerase
MSDQPLSAGDNDSDLLVWKYHALGNDFVLIEWPDGPDFTASRVAAICDRHRGVGADGLLLLTAPQGADLAPRMVVLNADGSRPEMCGNGLRCAAFHWATRLPHGASSSSFVVRTDAGPRHCFVEQDAAHSASVRVDMGEVSEPAPFVLRDPDLKLLLVSVGNPHAVLLEPVDIRRVQQLGPTVCNHSAFPDGVNVGFAQVLSPTHIRLMVWERGVGLTLACGTGACAAVAAAAARQLVEHSTTILVDLPGGQLSVTLDAATRHAQLTGPAVRVLQAVAFAAGR